MELIRIELNPFEIAFDKENPRDETQKQIENEPNFKKLKEHIKQFGLFYPIGVKEEKTDGKKYVLIDGERRLRVCQSLKFEKIPVILVKGDFDKRILAYQLHMLEKPWDMKVRVKSTRLIISELKKEKKSEQEILISVEKLTKMPKERIKDILRILRYSEKVVKSIEKKESKRTYLIESEKNFIPFIKTKFPDLYKEYGVEKIRKIIGEKLLNDKLGKTKSFRDFKSFVNKECGNKKDIVKKFMVNFFKNGNANLNQTINGIREYNKKEGKRILEIIKTKKDVPQTEDEVIITQMNFASRLISKEKCLIKNNIFDLIFKNLKESIKEYEKRSNFEINDELKLQDFLYSVLRCLFISVDFENPTEKVCGTSNKMDLVIKDHNVVIETKFVRDKNDHKRIFKELAEDYHKYKQTRYKKNMINYIYDPNNYLSQSHSLFRKELNQSFKGTKNYVG